MSILEELRTLVRTALEAAAPAVVSIGRDGRGTGFVVAPGRVVTNAHNLRDRTTSVGFADGRTAQASVAGADVDGDVVVLDVDTADATPLQWSDEELGAGDVVVAITAGRQRLRATWGQVTGADRGFRGPRGRPIAGAIEHTAPAAAGSSGAPVLDSDGKVVGINTHRIEHGFYLARAADPDLRARIAAMGEGRSYERPRLGVALAPPRVAAGLRRSVGLPDRDGLLVRGVTDGSPAAAAGIREGDLLVRAGDRDLVSVDDLFAALGDVQPGGELAVTLVRGTDEQTVAVSFPASS
jgi:S1-C subfamily serine protease